MFSKILSVTRVCRKYLKIHESKTATAAEIAQTEQVLKNVNKRDRGNNSYQDNEADKNVKISDLNNIVKLKLQICRACNLRFD